MTGLYRPGESPILPKYDPEDLSDVVPPNDPGGPMFDYPGLPIPPLEAVPAPEQNAPPPGADSAIGEVATPVSWRFETHFHPYVHRFQSITNLFGVAGLLRPGSVQDADQVAVLAGARRQRFAESGHPVWPTDSGSPSPLAPVLTPNWFQRLTLPSFGNGVVAPPYPIELVEFGRKAAYGQYNFELFLLAPWLIAKRLRSEGRHEEAQTWLHAVFNPVPEPGDPAVADGVDGRSIDQPWAWKVAPLFDYAKDLPPVSDEAAYSEWLKHPFDPWA